jgi:hypothetical protein
MGRERRAMSQYLGGCSPLVANSPSAFRRRRRSEQVAADLSGQANHEADPQALVQEPLPDAWQGQTSGTGPRRPAGGVLIARDIGVRRWMEASPQHTKGDAGTQERLRRSDHANDPDKGAGQRGVVGGGGM